MACKGAKKNVAKAINQVVQVAQPKKIEEAEVKNIEKLFFGVDSKVQADDILQNNLSHFEWIVRNKLYPNFLGRNLVGKNHLTKNEIDFIHDKGCKIASVYSDAGEKRTLEQGQNLARKANATALELGIPKETAIFLEINEKESVTSDFMKGYAEILSVEGYTPGFKANTDAKFDFDREFSRGLQTDKEVFGKCLVWAVAPILAEYERVTTTHLIHPDNWIPFAPSGITRNDIAVWQYGKDCHPINNNAGIETTFCVNLVRDDKIIIDKMF